MIVFLDIDGVLKLDWGSVQWTKSCINVLNTLTRELNLKYVVTSTWRVANSKEELQKIFIKQGIIGEIIDYTPILCQDRGFEIAAWLNDNPTTEWICLDDKITDIKEHIDPDRIYECDFIKGLTESIGNKILKRFK